MYRLFLIVMVCMVFLERSSAQSNGYSQYGLLYSQTHVFGSSRTQGLAGAGVAIGGDISSASINPAGLGLSRKSEISISTSFGNSSTDAAYFGNSNSDNRFYFGFPNFGVVLSSLKDDMEEGDFRGGSFAISFTKVANFQNKYTYSGFNPYNSIGDYLAMQAGNTPFSEFNDEYDDNSISSLSSAAFTSSVIDPVFYVNGGDTTQVGYQFGYNTSRRRQTESVLSTGGVYNWDFSYGGNYKDRLYFGLGLTIARLNHYTEMRFTEDILEPRNSELTKITTYNDKSARGTGIGLKGGFIVRPHDAFRFGISFQTPTYYSIKEIYNDNFNSTFNNKPFLLTLPVGNNEYGIITPFKVSPGATVFFGKHGFLTSEVQFVNYSSARFTNNTANLYAGDNTEIKNSYSNAVNFKLATEIRFLDIFRARAGYAVNSNPYRGGPTNILGFFNNESTLKGNDFGMYTVTTGGGVRFDNSYFDFAFIFSKFRTYRSPYSAVDFSNLDSQYGIDVPGAGPAPSASIFNRLTTFNLTFGTYF